MKHKKLLFFVAASVMTFGVLTPAILKQSEKVEPDSAEYDNNTVADYYKPDVKYVAPKRAVTNPTGIRFHYRGTDCTKKELWIWADSWAGGQDVQRIQATSATAEEATFNITYTGAYADLAKRKSLWLIVKYKKSEKGEAEWVGKSNNTEIKYEEFVPGDDGLVEVWAIPGEGSSLEVYKTEKETKMDRFQAASFDTWKQLTVTATDAPSTYKLYALTSSFMRMGQAEQEAKLHNYLIAEGENPTCTTVTEGSFVGSKQFKINLKYTVKPNVQYYLTGSFPKWSEYTKTKYVAFHNLYEDSIFNRYYNYDGNDLGATYNSADKSTTFKVWAPTAARVRLLIYKSGTPTTVAEQYEGVEGSDDYGGYNMAFRPGGVWEVTIKNKDLKNSYYNYYVVNSLGENIAVDPYAKACGVNGERGMVVDWSETNPEGWDDVPAKWDGEPGYDIANPNALSIYETHVRDLTMHSSWTGSKTRGTFAAFAESGTTLASDPTVKTGFDHIKEMGVKAVQLVPVFDHDNAEDPLNRTFNWGYNPKNYNCVEGSYAEDAFDGTARIKEYKGLIKALATNGNNTRTIMDVVYNHVASATEHPFHILMPRYYFRYTDNVSYWKTHGFPEIQPDELWDGSGCGNEVKSEAPMCSKYIVDSLCWWAKEYKVKGFRFDLMGLIDWKTIQKAAQELYKIDPDIYIYGEGWTGDGGDAHIDQSKYPGNWGANTWTVYEKLQKTNNACYIGAFNDAARNNLKGENSGVGTDQFEGFLSISEGSVGTRSQVVADMMVGYHTGHGAGQSDHSAAAKQDPNMCINYASCHDNFTLFDQFSGARNIGANANGAAAATAAAECAILMSNGVAFIQGGEELFRSKEITDPEDLKLAKESDYAVINGKKISHNSYNLSDKVNAFDWNRKKTFATYSNAISKAVKERNNLTKFTYNEVTTINPYKYSDNAKLQLWTSQGRDGDWPNWNGATTIAYMNEKYTIIIAGMNNDQVIGFGDPTSYTQPFNTNAPGYDKVTGGLDMWGYTTICFKYNG